MTTHSHFDTPWKLILERYLQSVFDFLFPEVAEQIDWSHPYRCLDKELLALQRKAKVGTRLADKLVEVLRKDGEKAFVLIHLEIQGAQDKDFAERMYRYYYRIDDRHQKPLMSVAILTDKNPTWRPNQYSKKLWGCELTLTYPIIKLIDFEADLERLAQSRNPIAKVIEAHLAALRTQTNTQLRFENKLRLVKNLYHLGYTKTEVLDLYTFIDYALNLEPDLEKQFMINMTQYEEEVVMQHYITSAERIGIEKGIETGERKILKILLEQKFGHLAQNVIEKVDQANELELEKILIASLKTNNIQEIF